MRKTRKCRHCGEATVNPRYCSNSCSATHNQTGRVSNNKGKSKYKSADEKHSEQNAKRRARYSERTKNNAKQPPQGIKSPKPYRGYRVFGPRVENTGRWSVHLYNPTIRRQFTKSLARYIMEVGLGRKLERNQHVDHIDGNPLNDRWDNLQVLCAKDNIAKGSANGVTTRKYIRFTCPVCGKRVSKRNIHKHTNTNHAVFACSRSCGRKLPILKKDHSEKSLRKRMRLRCFLRKTKHAHSGVGERIPRRTKGMRRVHNFTLKKGVAIL